MVKIKIRLTRSEDFPVIRAIQRSTWVATYGTLIPEAVIRKYMRANKNWLRFQLASLKKKSTHSWVAEIEKKVVGYCVSTRGDMPEVNAIYVLPHYQGFGLGKELMKKAMTWLHKEDIVIVWVVQNNKKAIDFYKRFGFKKTRKKQNYDFHGYTMPLVQMIYQKN